MNRKNYLANYLITHRTGISGSHNCTVKSSNPLVYLLLRMKVYEANGFLTKMIVTEVEGSTYYMYAVKDISFSLPKTTTYLEKI